MIEDDWHLVDHTDTWLDEQGAAELRPAPGKRQYVNQKPPGASTGDDDEDANQMMLVRDRVGAGTCCARCPSPSILPAPAPSFRPPSTAALACDAAHAYPVPTPFIHLPTRRPRRVRRRCPT